METAHRLKKVLIGKAIHGNPERKIKKESPSLERIPTAVLRRLLHSVLPSIQKWMIRKVFRFLRLFLAAGAPTWRRSSMRVSTGSTAFTSEARWLLSARRRNMANRER